MLYIVLSIVKHYLLVGVKGEYESSIHKSIDKYTNVRYNTNVLKIYKTNKSNISKHSKKKGNYTYEYQGWHGIRIPCHY
jgi:hypothetical protein